jgi:hypothetical protein
MVEGTMNGLEAVDFRVSGRLPVDFRSVFQSWEPFVSSNGER